MQVLCVLIGAAAFTSVRREKRTSASLFEQRKQSRAKRYSDARNSNSDIEMGRLEETVPLTANDDAEEG